VKKPTTMRPSTPPTSALFPSPWWSVPHEPRQPGDSRAYRGLRLCAVLQVQQFAQLVGNGVLVAGELGQVAAAGL
jgi:hypothetical protein